MIQAGDHQNNRAPQRARSPLGVGRGEAEGSMRRWYCWWPSERRAPRSHQRALLKAHDIGDNKSSSSPLRSVNVQWNVCETSSSLREVARLLISCPSCEMFAVRSRISRPTSCCRGAACRRNGRPRNGDRCGCCRLPSPCGCPGRRSTGVADGLVCASRRPAPRLRLELPGSPIECPQKGEVHGHHRQSQHLGDRT